LLKQILNTIKADRPLMLDTLNVPR